MRDGESEEQCEDIRALIAENKRLVEEKIKDDLERRKEVEGLRKEIDALKEANQKLQDEKIQVAYNYGLNIIQNMNLHEKIVIANEMTLQLRGKMEGYKAEIARLRRDV